MRTFSILKSLITLTLGFSLLNCSAANRRGGTPSVPDQPNQAGPQRSPGSVQTVSGEVMGVDGVAVQDQNYLTLRLRISDSPTPVEVRLGPGWYLDEHGLHFEPNEHISVQGSRQLVNGQPVLLATEVTKDGKTHQLPPSGTPMNSPPANQSPSK